MPETIQFTLEYPIYYILVTNQTITQIDILSEGCGGLNVITVQYSMMRAGNVFIPFDINYVPRRIKDEMLEFQALVRGTREDTPEHLEVHNHCKKDMKLFHRHFRFKNKITPTFFKIFLAQLQDFQSDKVAREKGVEIYLKIPECPRTGPLNATQIYDVDNTEEDIAARKEGYMLFWKTSQCRQNFGYPDPSAEHLLISPAHIEDAVDKYTKYYESPNRYHPADQCVINAIMTVPRPSEDALPNVRASVKKSKSQARSATMDSLSIESGVVMAMCSFILLALLVTWFCKKSRKVSSPMGRSNGPKMEIKGSRRSPN